MKLAHSDINLNTVYCMDCVKGMEMLPDGCIDLTVTSPPYDDLRTYEGYSFDFESVANQLFRVTKDGGVVVWVVGDQTVDGDESGTSFKQALYFKEVGFKLADTMIYHKTDTAFARRGHKKYPAAFEYMFVLSKGKINTWNPIKDRPNKKAGTVMCGTVRQKDGSTLPSHTNGKKVAKLGTRTNVWGYSTGKYKSATDAYAYEHPAIFPEQLARDHILTWSNPGDIVFDPFMGSGTTAKMSHLLGRPWLGFDISKEYVPLSAKRIAAVSDNQESAKGGNHRGCL